MFALFGEPSSGGKELVERVRLNTRLELLMKPVKDMATLATLDFTTCISNGDMTLPSLLEASTLFLKEDIGQHGQSPEAEDGGRTHELIVIQAKLFLAVAKEHFDVPPSRDMDKQRLWVSFQITGSEVACLRKWIIKRSSYNHHLTAIEL